MIMTDFHTHILPKMDDGASSSAESVAMLTKLSEQQVASAVLTPHFYSHREPLSAFLNRRAASYERLLQNELPSIDLTLGAEVYLSEFLFNIPDLSPLCIKGTRTLLLELPYGQPIDDSVIDSVDRVITEYSVRPVIAHIERYPSLMRNKKHLEQLMHSGCVLQVNLSSCTGFGARRVISLFKNGYVGAVGTDAHNMSTRPPDYHSGFMQLQRSLSNEDLETLQQSMRSLLSAQ